MAGTFDPHNPPMCAGFCSCKGIDTFKRHTRQTGTKYARYIDAVSAVHKKSKITGAPHSIRRLYANRGQGQRLTRTFIVIPD